MNQLRLLGLIFLLGCTPLANSNVSISPIQTVQQQQENRRTQVYLKGEVVQVAPFLQGGAYLLQDETGKIWVLREGDLPQVGDVVEIAGQTQYQSVPIENREFGEVYIQER
ncbi:hypothetical protein IQ249_18495 [Lusitaniella coriacea LEGE 07157]|uniref:DNA-binding protein n=1 Tax=Lusitaniella coriacea LEGE 07157 TaxID=945747 RepID=A0A8J7DYL1_9CYAN|nr:hypothetical protein [Lusitaniella coriacea]MBE9117891.1 hypothetical protein [Lusitaniella coriacea LEGE 07157]